LHWSSKGRYLVTFLVSISPHVDVACFSIHGEDIAETIAVPVAYVDKLTVSLGVEDLPVRIPRAWI
jgi:hypothetical protein